MREIQLNRGYIALVDDEDYEKVNQYKWHVDEAVNSTGILYARSAIYKPKKQMIRMHRIVLNLNKEDKVLVDHIDTNGLNNQKLNLRIVSRSQNGANQKKRLGKKKTSIHKGVSWIKCRNKWMAQINVNQRLKFLGRFDSEEEAHEAYKSAAPQYFGEYARFD